MRTLGFLILLFLICSCGDNNHDSDSTLANETDFINKQATSLEEEIQHLLVSGLHFARLSNLQDPKRPMTLYCSNTASLNHEKIEKLLAFSELIESDNQETYVINKIEVKNTVLLQLLQDAARLLEQDPYSSTCPQIYLAIQSS